MLIWHKFAQQGYVSKYVVFTAVNKTGFASSALAQFEGIQLVNNLCYIYIFLRHVRNVFVLLSSRPIMHYGVQRAVAILHDSLLFLE